jgi:hypothetical protein
MNIVAIKYNDGVAIMQIIESSGLTVAQHVARAFGDDTLEYSVINLSDLPNDNYFRKAWELSNGSVSVNIEKAKDIQRNHWRELRKPKLEALDLAYMRALEDGNTEMQLNIVAQKNALRDVTSTSLPNNLNRIKATIPKILL